MKNTSKDSYYFNQFKKYIEKYKDADYGYDAILKYLEDEDYYKGIFIKCLRNNKRKF